MAVLDAPLRQTAGSAGACAAGHATGPVARVAMRGELLPMHAGVVVSLSCVRGALSPAVGTAGSDSPTRSHSQEDACVSLSFRIALQSLVRCMDVPSERCFHVLQMRLVACVGVRVLAAQSRSQ